MWSIRWSPSFTAFLNVLKHFICKCWHYIKSLGIVDIFVSCTHFIHIYKICMYTIIQVWGFETSVYILKRSSKWLHINNLICHGTVKIFLFLKIFSMIENTSTRVRLIPDGNQSIFLDFLGQRTSDFSLYLAFLLQNYYLTRYLPLK